MHASVRYSGSVGTPNLKDLIVLATLALAHQFGMHHSGGPMGGPGFGLFFVLIPLFWIVVIALFVGFGRRRMRRLWAANGGHPGLGGGHGFGGYGGFASRGAESTLAERFAQGDIDEVEYRARLEVLRANR
jgi:putative membrane protein